MTNAICCCCFQSRKSKLINERTSFWITRFIKFTVFHKHLLHSWVCTHRTGQYLTITGGRTVLDCIKQKAWKKTHVQRQSNKFQSSGHHRYYSANRINCNRFVEFNGDRKKRVQHTCFMASTAVHIYIVVTHQNPHSAKKNKKNYESSITFRGHGTFVAGLRRDQQCIYHILSLIYAIGQVMYDL